jgi:hypothetical protein
VLADEFIVPIVECESPSGGGAEGEVDHVANLGGGAMRVMRPQARKLHGEDVARVERVFGAFLVPWPRGLRIPKGNGEALVRPLDTQSHTEYM